MSELVLIRSVGLPTPFVAFFRVDFRRKVGLSATTGPDLWDSVGLDCSRRIVSRYRCRVPLPAASRERPPLLPVPRLQTFSPAAANDSLAFLHSIERSA